MLHGIISYFLAVYYMSDYNEFLKKWSRVNQITSFFGSDKPDFIRDWNLAKRGTKFEISRGKFKPVETKPIEELNNELRNARIERVILKKAIEGEPRPVEDKKLRSLYEEYKSLHRAKYTNKVREKLELVEDEMNKITRPLLKEELEQGYFTDSENQRIRFKLIQPKKNKRTATNPLGLGYSNLYLSFINEKGNVIEDLTRDGIENENTNPYIELLSAISQRYKWRLFYNTAGLRNVESLQELLPNLL